MTTDCTMDYVGETKNMLLTGSEALVVCVCVCMIYWFLTVNKTADRQLGFSMFTANVILCLEMRELH